MRTDIAVTGPVQTAAFAEQFAKTLRPGDVVALFGDLGAGKTLFVKAACAALGVPKEATSPTFTIINEYHAPHGLMIHHFDFYRIQHQAELFNLGLEEYFFSDNICFIEWPEKIAAELPTHRYEVYLEFQVGQPQTRHIRVYSVT